MSLFTAAQGLLIKIVRIHSQKLLSHSPECLLERSVEKIQNYAGVIEAYDHKSQEAMISGI